MVFQQYELQIGSTCYHRIFFLFFVNKTVKTKTKKLNPSEGLEEFCLQQFHETNIGGKL
jgi:hypothetical protein